MNYKMKIEQLVVLVVLVVVLLGCSVGGRLSRGSHSASIGYVESETKVEDSLVTKQWRATKPIELNTKEGESLKYLPTEVVKGRRVMNIYLQEVTVIAKSRTVVERMGRVNLDFVVSLPKYLLGNIQSVTVIPVLHINGEDRKLEELAIRGELFSRVQERNYWQYERYLKIFKPSSEEGQMAFDRFITYPYPEGVRLDSIVERSSAVDYYYTQEVATNDVVDALLITLRGSVVALDHSFYELPISDTLQYRISSMTSFIDTTPRFLTKVVEKYVVVNDRNYLNFNIGDTRIIDTLSDNREQLSGIERLMDEVLVQKEFYVDSIVLTASSSAEGSMVLNERLAKGRAIALRDYLVNRFKGRDIEKLLVVRWIGEDWDRLVELIEDNTLMANKEAILTLIERGGNLDAVELEIKRKYPADYKVMFETLYPLLRSVDFKYDLRRVGMVKDTIHTTLPDTLYAQGVELLKERNYLQSFSILESYKDRNTAIAQLSLGYDAEAYEILQTLDQCAIVYYLRAVACARLGKKSEGLLNFERACELIPWLKGRGKLDPEITLLKQLEDEK